MTIKFILVAILAFFGISGSLEPILQPVYVATTTIEQSKAIVAELKAYSPTVIPPSTSREPTEPNRSLPEWLPPIFIVNIPYAQPIQVEPPATVVQLPSMPESQLTITVTYGKPLDEYNPTPYSVHATYSPLGDTLPFALTVDGNPNEIDSGDTSIRTGTITESDGVWSYYKSGIIQDTPKFTIKVGDLVKTTE